MLTNSKVDDALQSLDDAIATALDSGASPHDIARVVRGATSIFHDEKTKSNKSLYGVCSNRDQVLILLLFLAVSVSIAYAVLFREMFLKELIEKDVEEIIETNVVVEWSEKEELSAAGKFTIEEAFQILNLQKKKRDFKINAFALSVKETNKSCPLDVFFDNDCHAQAGGELCFFPGVILKRGRGHRAGYFQKELKAFKLLNDTRFFPELYYYDEKCQTLLQENVRLGGETKNSWCSKYSVYEDFYKNAFEYFTTNNIYPKDLNTCCNTIVNDNHIRIIDFGMYVFDTDPEEVGEKNKGFRAKILKDVEQQKEKEKARCAVASLR
mmetsp:Transcript_16877/g.25531  ORF Transcript_16877/g.25531 Transcript_16877/m.25531 type:complete len:325 (+) Transcript_16877:39-1013(+)